jgi:hypothetical protein
MAKGWVLSCRKVNALDEEYQDACTFFAKSFAYRSERMACGISSYCLKMAAMNSIEDAIKWAHLHNTEVVPFMTDEEGFFKAGPLKENVVMVFAYGQSGMQQCIWSESGIVFKFAGFENNIKLSKPVIAWQ